MAFTPSNPNGQTTKANSQPVVLASDQDALAVTNALGATSAKQDAGNTSLSSIDGKITAVNTGAVVVSSSALPSGASLASKQAALGTAGTPSADVLTVQGKSGMTALAVDPSGVTSPVSIASVPSHAVTNAGTFATQSTLQAGSAIVGKVTTDQTTHGTTDLVAADITKIAGTAADVNSGNKSAGTIRVVLATDQPALTNKLLVTPDSVALPANQSVNTSQINGVTPLMGNGASGTGAQRVTIASDSTGQIALAAGGATIGALTANQSVNVAQLAGNTISSGVGASGTGTLRMVEANDVGRILKSAGGSASSSGNNTLVAAGTNKLKVFGFSLTTTSTTAVTCIFQSGAGGTELWRVVLQAPTSVNVGANLAVAAPAYLFNTASATLLNLNLSGAQTVHWSVAYFDEA